MELLLFSLPRLASFGGSDASRDSFPAPIIRASKRLSFLNVFESVPAIAAGKFSIANPSSEISMMNPTQAHPNEVGKRSERPACGVEGSGKAERAKAGLFWPDKNFKFDGDRPVATNSYPGIKGQGSSSTAPVDRKQDNAIQLLKSRKTHPSLLFLLSGGGRRAGRLSPRRSPWDERMHTKYKRAMKYPGLFQLRDEAW